MSRISDWGKTAKRKVKRGAVRTRRAAKKTPLGYYAPMYGPDRTLAGYKTSKKTQKARAKARKKSAKTTKRIFRRSWRKLV